MDLLAVHELIIQLHFHGQPRFFIAGSSLDGMCGIFGRTTPNAARMITKVALAQLYLFESGKDFLRSLSPQIAAP
jgi:hypothetical protein